LRLKATEKGGVLSNSEDAGQEEKRLMEHLGRLKTMPGALAVLILAGIPAWATLGQSEASVTTDQLQMKTQARVQSLPNYKVHQLTSATGSMIQEFVSPQGRVFAVTWRGRSVPDMNQLLGAPARPPISSTLGCPGSWGEPSTWVSPARLSRTVSLRLTVLSRSRRFSPYRSVTASGAG
jgi:hypothetical protein